MSITFSVSPVEPSKLPLRGVGADSVRHLFGPAGVEAWGANEGSVWPSEEHPFLAAVHWAFAFHYPLALTPDAVWLVLTQGVSLHLQKYPETVKPAGERVALLVRRDDFVAGSPDNPWPEVFGAFADAVTEHLGDLSARMRCTFSTTGPIERAAQDVVLLEAVQSHFDYELETLCGIPEITLEGTVEDWRLLRQRAASFASLGLEAWMGVLLPVLDAFVEAASGRVDGVFWRRFFKWNDESGGPYVTGWIHVFFPYLVGPPRQTGASPFAERIAPNPVTNAWEGFGDAFRGAPTQRMPPRAASVPFVWTYLGTRRPMEMMAGFVGVSQSAATLALRPAIGWAVRPAHGDTPHTRPAWTADVWEGTPDLHEEGDEEERSLRLARAPAAWFAGRTSAVLALSARELEALQRRLGGLLAGRDQRLEAAWVGDESRVPFVPVRGRLLLGVELSSHSDGDFPVGAPEERLERLDIDEGTWAALAAEIPGGLSKHNGLHLVAAPGHAAGIRFGGFRPPPSNRFAGFTVWRVDPRTPYLDIQCRPSDDEARRRDVEQLGICGHLAAYYLEVDWTYRAADGEGDPEEA